MSILNPFLEGDNDRFTLLTRLVCVQCGNPLVMTNKKVVANYSGEFNTELANVANNIVTSRGPQTWAESCIAVYPCSNCYGKVMEPIEALKKALGYDKPA